MLIIYFLINHSKADVHKPLLYKFLCMAKKPVDSPSLVDSAGQEVATKIRKNDPQADL